MSKQDSSKESDQIDGLLERWELLRAQGQSPTVEELCVDCPELAEELERRLSELEKIGDLLEEEGGGVSVDSVQPFDLIQHDEVELTLHLKELTLFDLGGMGVVGRAKDSELRRDVAVKFMKPTSSSPINQERFLNEAKVTGRMAHPGVLPVYGYGRTSDKLPFYAMRYVTGPTFEEAINDYHRERKNQTRRQQIVSLRKLLTHFVSVAYTIAYAHERGVVHCDLKPRNILLGAFGETYVIDWGLAVGVSPSKGNFTGVAERRDAHGAGTQGYSHPDQLSGENPPHRVWDIYGLGAVLYKLLTNRATNDLPKKEPVLDKTAKTSVPIRNPRSVERSIPAPLESICLQALGVEAEHHYERASEVADDVERYLSGEAVAGHAEAFWEKLFRWQRSHQGATKIAGILLLMLVTVLVASSLSLWRFAETNETKTRESLQTAVRFAAQTVALEMNNRWQALNLAARDTKLLLSLENLDPASLVHGSEVLQARIKYHRYSFQGLKSDSWFLCTAIGQQVARSPVSNRSTGNFYGHRDYFHGNGQDYAVSEEHGLLPGDPPYIERPHHSVVYQSTSDRSLKVAYSVPVFTNPGTDEERFLGVIGMSVKLGGFRILSGALLADHHLILVDLRDDWLEGEPKKGLILHHPLLGEQVQQVGDDSKRPRLAEALVKRLLTLRSNDPSFYLEDFVDPVTGVKEGSLAAFAKVMVSIDGEFARDSGWAVIVKEGRGPRGFF